MTPTQISSRKIVIAVTGASGAIYAHLLLKKIASLPSLPQLGMVMSKNAQTVWEHELGHSDWNKFPFPIFDKTDFHAPFASGSARYDSMVIIPCSMGTMGRIANGISDDLITRAADVMLKERKKLILAVRETPYNTIHLKNMLTLSKAGAILCPASPSFYSRPANLEEAAATVVDRILDIIDLPVPTYRWAASSTNNKD